MVKKLAKLKLYDRFFNSLTFDSDGRTLLAANNNITMDNNKPLGGVAIFLYY